jgi:hypothetical protein
VPGNPARTRLEETMAGHFDKRRRRGPLRSRPRRPRMRLGGCLLWLLGLLIVLVILALLFGGFQKGTKVNGTGPPGSTAAAGQLRYLTRAAPGPRPAATAEAGAPT